MKYFKNLENSEVVSLKNLISYKKNQIVSMALSKVENVDIRLFALYENEEIRNEVYPMDTLYYCLEGTLQVFVNDKEYFINEGEVITISVGESSSLISSTNAKMMQIMIKETNY